MSDPLNLETSDTNDTEDANAENNTRNLQHPKITIAGEDDHDSNNESDNILESILAESDEIKKATEDVSHTEKAEKLSHKRSINMQDSHVDVATYLRTEFSATDKLPKYKEIDMIGYSRKYIDEESIFTTIIRHFRRRKRRYFSKTATVHFQTFGGENMPETRVMMEYEPETRNYTVKGMFVSLMVLHFMTWFFSFFLWASPPRDIFVTHGHLICIGPFALYFLLIISATCFQLLRKKICVGCAAFLAFFFLSTGTASIAGYLSTRIFNFSFITLFWSDLICVLLGCYEFDYMSKRLYFIAIGSGAIFLSLIIPGMEVYCTYMMYYWGDFPKETVVGYVLCVVFTLGSLAVIVAELQLLLGGEWVELGEDDYTFGGFLLFVSLIDFPIRICRKYGVFGEKGEGEGEEDEE